MGLRPTTAPVGRLAEVILHVDDMAAQVAFYRDKLGLRVLHESARWTTFDAGGCVLALHGGSRVGLTSNVRLAFTVDDIEAARAELIARGVRMGEIRAPAAGVCACDGIDAEGNEFSIDVHS